MSKPYAKIVVQSFHNEHQVTLESDSPSLWLRRFHKSRRAALVQARAWSRRLGGIPVEEEGQCSK